MDIKKQLDETLRKRQAQTAHDTARHMIQRAAELGEKSLFDFKGFTPEMVSIITKDLSAKGLKLEKTPEGYFRAVGDCPSCLPFP